ncbi:hypothetical protein [Aquibacillus rhizosphaerae]|uniref:Uncharacterized protein n=1 Tax=Aquibacillus rhizosphaerae TaxID=3051431 RepID=A0ABT7L9C6_9BACI|nr:hypothetical protein [Aquibacillus sp. LR5S19]MDL4842474.1 hypothetical protein [Aquibacillus sp. LR5S19]
MSISRFSGLSAVVNYIKNHQLSDAVVKSGELDEIKHFLAELLELAMKLDNLNIELDLKAKVDVSEWVQYDKDLETLVKQINVKLKNNHNFATSAIC